MSQSTQELLFEIYDHAVKPNHKFLGLGIVGVEELLVNPSQRQTIGLQSRPYESDQVSGTLTVEVRKKKIIVGNFSKLPTFAFSLCLLKVLIFQFSVINLIK